MHRTTLMLPPELKSQAQKQARKLGISLGELIRRALAAELSSAGRERRAEDPLFSDGAVFRGQVPADLARDHDRYLYDEPA